VYVTPGVQNSFFTVQSVLTLTGASGATLLVSNGIQRAFNVNPRWLALVIAELICIFGVLYGHGRSSDYVLAVINGFLVFSTAVGANQMTGTAAPSPKSKGEQRELERPQVQSRSFLTRWF